MPPRAVRQRRRSASRAGQELAAPTPVPPLNGGHHFTQKGKDMTDYESTMHAVRSAMAAHQGDVARAISYSDPAGEQAARNIDRERRAA